MKKSLLLLTVAVIFLAGCSCKHQERNIVVQGSYLKKIMPDKASINVRISVLKPTSQEASKEAQSRYTAFNNLVKDLKGLEMQTSEYSIDREYQYQGKEKGNVFVGYRANMGLEVPSNEIDKMGEVIEKTAQIGFTEAYNFNIYISNELYKKEREAGLAQAVSNARDKAKAMAQAGGTKVGKLVYASEYGMASNSGEYECNQSFGLMKNRSVMAYEASPAPMIQTKQQDMEVTVSAVFELK